VGKLATGGATASTCIGVGLNVLFAFWHPQNPAIQRAGITVGIILMGLGAAIFLGNGIVWVRNRFDFQSPLRRKGEPPQDAISDQEPRGRPWFFVLPIVIILGMFQWYLNRSFLNSPDLSGDLDIIGVGADHNNPDTSVITLIAHVKNKGTPCAIDSWTISAKLASGDIIEGKRRAISIPVRINLHSGGSLTYPPENALYQRTIVPIPMGGVVYGLLIADFPTVPPLVFHAGAATVIVTFRDVMGNDHRIERPISSISSEPLYFPGMTVVKEGG
jgi:hypothetical protein